MCLNLAVTPAVVLFSPIEEELLIRAKGIVQVRDLVLISVPFYSSILEKCKLARHDFYCEMKSHYENRFSETCEHKENSRAPHTLGEFYTA